MKIVCKSILRIKFVFLSIVKLTYAVISLEGEEGKFFPLNMKRESMVLKQDLRILLGELSDVVSPVPPENISQPPSCLSVPADLTLFFFKNENEWHYIYCKYIDDFFPVAIVKNIDRKIMLEELKKKYNLQLVIRFFKTNRFEIACDMRHNPASREQVLFPATNQASFIGPCLSTGHTYSMDRRRLLAYVETVNVISKNFFDFLQTGNNKFFVLKEKIKENQQLLFNGAVFLQIYRTRYVPNSRENRPYKISLLTAFGELPLVRLEEISIHAIYAYFCEKCPGNIHSSIDSFRRVCHGISFYRQSVIQHNPSFYPEKIRTGIKTGADFIKSAVTKTP